MVSLTLPAPSTRQWTDPQPSTSSLSQAASPLHWPTPPGPCGRLRVVLPCTLSLRPAGRDAPGQGRDPNSKEWTGNKGQAWGHAQEDKPHVAGGWRSHQFHVVERGE